ncbi:MAG TPA: hypothetical protein VGH89_10195 [Pseudonocardia sp.]|jgi:hypothetical protein
MIMWEDLTVALSGIGFAWVVALLVIELPQVLNPRYAVRHRGQS